MTSDMPPVISDSSTLIHLGRIGRLGLLKEMFGVIVIPPAVWHEVVIEGGGRPGVADVRGAREAGWIQIREPEDMRLLQILKSELDIGEAEAITLTVETHADLLLLDESEGRRIAEIYHLPKTGVIGILIRAKLEGRIESLRRELDALRQEGRFWIADTLYFKALDAVGEEVR